METTIAHLRNRIEFHATLALDQVQIGPDLPIDLFPTNSVSFTHECDKLFQVPILIDHMLGSHLAIAVDKAGTLAA